MKKITLAFVLLLSFIIMPSYSKEFKNPLIPHLEEEQIDGPYVQYTDDRVLVNYIIQSNGEKKVRSEAVDLRNKNDLSLKVMTDVPGKSFQVSLKKKLKTEKTEFAKP